MSRVDTFVSSDSSLCVCALSVFIEQRWWCRSYSCQHFFSGVLPYKYELLSSLYLNFKLSEGTCFGGKNVIKTVHSLSNVILYIYVIQMFKLIHFYIDKSME